jgi:hypothetical protein
MFQDAQFVWHLLSLQQMKHLVFQTHFVLTLQLLILHQHQHNQIQYVLQAAQVDNYHSMVNAQLAQFQIVILVVSVFQVQQSVKHALLVILAFFY